jgi:hypothetical protein
MGWARSTACVVECVCKTIVRKCEEKIALERPSNNKANRFKRGVRSVLGGVNWIKLIQVKKLWQTLMNTAIKF